MIGTLSSSQPYLQLPMVGTLRNLYLKPMQDPGAVRWAGFDYGLTVNQSDRVWTSPLPLCLLEGSQLLPLPLGQVEGYVLQANDAHAMLQLWPLTGAWPEGVSFRVYMNVTELPPPGPPTSSSRHYGGLTTCSICGRPRELCQTVRRRHAVEPC